jgi:HEAT repeat protein
MKKALNSMTDKAASAPTDNPQISALLESLTDSDPDVRRETAQDLGDLIAGLKKPGQPVAAPPELVNTLYDSDTGVREAASWALGLIADPDTTPALASRLQDEDRRVQSRAAWALSRIRTPRALAAVEAWYADQRLRDNDAD